MTDESTVTDPVDYEVVDTSREIVRYSQLLSIAHEQGLKSIETAIVQLPTLENGMTAICSATVTTSNGVFSDSADATPENVREGAEPHIIRVALTRAKARALRDAVNFGLQFPEGPPETEPELRHGHPPSGPVSIRPITEAQIKKLHSLMEGSGKKGSEIDRELCKELGVKQLSEATLTAASELIKKLMAEPANKKTTAK